jgi:hypothetical protein
MNHCRGWTVLLALTGLLIFLGSGQTAQPEKGDPAAKKFEKLKAKLPKIVEEVTKEKDEILGVLLDTKVEIEVARRISADQAKITVSLVHKDRGEVLDASIFLRFFEGHWTTVRGEGQVLELSPAGKDAVVQRFLRKLMRAIDKASND